VVAAERVVARCGELARISEEEGRLTRWFGGAAMERANALVGGWMEQAGMEVRTDSARNLIGRVPGADPGAGTLLLGSHLDTVRDAGAFDGPLGVIAAIECVAALRARELTLPFAVEVIGFSDEEGLRYGTAYLGSRALAGDLGPELLELRDGAGVPLAEALAGDPSAAARRDERLVGYIELHIEQGPVLERAGLPVGVVAAIAGATRAEVRFRGRAGHAGTEPMDGRRDAVPALAELVLEIERAARDEPGLVATCGRIAAEPGAPNVVAAAASASVDVRHADDAVRESVVAGLRARAAAIAAQRGLAVEWSTLLETRAARPDAALTAALARAVAAAGVRAQRLASGAGHDAVAIAPLTGWAMLFVRCAGGVSHHPDESVAVADVAVALRVLDALLRDLAVSAGR
jgi:allantoate deiminase